MCPQVCNLMKAKPRTDQNAGVEVKVGPVRLRKKGFMSVKNPREEMRDTCLMKREAAF